SDAKGQVSVFGPGVVMGLVCQLGTVPAPNLDDRSSNANPILRGDLARTYVDAPQPAVLKHEVRVWEALGLEKEAPAILWI
ncbi:hypothetical protein, partial [Pelomonas sp. KK5]|uniref:hypothetical protein n=1 Tax=Pelomonas sp. KK5 TaxID=1855730 RepID=UPI001E5044A6